MRSDSPFLVHDPRHKRWAIPYTPETVAVRGERLLGQHRAYIEGKTVLDLGCHFGTWTMVCHEMGASHIVGLDSDEALIKQGQGFLAQEGVIPDQAELKVMDLVAHIHTLPDQSVDTVLCFGLLYYVPDPYAFLSQMKRLAKEAIILDTFTATYCAIQGKDAGLVAHSLAPSAYDLPILVHQLTQTQKPSYQLPHVVKTTDTPLTFLACPTTPLLELYFASLGLLASRIDWTPVLKNPGLDWQALLTKEGKLGSHWTDLYASEVRVSYLLTPS